MTTSDAVINAMPVENDLPSMATAGSVQRVCATPSGTAPADDEPTAIVRRALEMLDAVGNLLQVLSPSEVEATAERAHLGRLGDAHVGFWKVYCARHRVLVDVFATQRATFAERVLAYERRAAWTSSEPTAPVPEAAR